MIVCPAKAVRIFRMCTVGTQDLERPDTADVRQCTVLKTVVGAECVMDLNPVHRASSFRFSSRYSFSGPRIPDLGRYSNMDRLSRTV